MSSAPGPAEARPFGRVAVLGLGVMGGSLARALMARADRPDVVRGWSPVAGERDAARRTAAVDAAPDSWQEAVEGAELVVLATPLEATCTLLPEVGRTARSAVLTDLASLKAPVLDAARGAGLRDRWVGSHPMVGSERSGFGASRLELYDGAPVWLVADPEAKVACARLAALWRSVGAEPRETDADHHDRRMALVSHLPQLASTALARTLEAAGVEADALGPGGSDATRLAASSPEMWRELLGHAPPELSGALRALSGSLAELAALLDDDDFDAIEETMRATRLWRTR